MMQYSRFVVEDTPYCVWGWDLREQNKGFLKNLDPRYFDYLARTHLNALEGEDAQFAAVALRTAYHHGLETLFALLAATLQAPDCVVGWLQKYQIRQLRNLVTQIESRGPAPRNKLRLERVSWRLLSERVHAGAFPNHRDETVGAFADLWSRFSDEFLNELSDREYNNIKHGFRAGLGGFVLKAGVEPEYGVSPPAEEMQFVGGSEFGTSFFMPEKIGQAQGKSDPHFRLRLQNLNWRPEAMVQALQLISISLNNILGFLKILNGQDPKQTLFLRPEDPEFFTAPWRWSTGIDEMSINEVIEETDIKRLTTEEILAIYKDSGKTSSDSA
jgi:hypothetical protein